MKIKTVIQQQQNMVLLVTYALYTHTSYTPMHICACVCAHTNSQTRIQILTHTLSLCHTYKHTQSQEHILKIYSSAFQRCSVYKNPSINNGAVSSTKLLILFILAQHSIRCYRLFRAQVTKMTIFWYCHISILNFIQINAVF